MKPITNQIALFERKCRPIMKHIACLEETGDADDGHREVLGRQSYRMATVESDQAAISHHSVGGKDNLNV